MTSRIHRSFAPLFTLLALLGINAVTASAQTPNLSPPFRQCPAIGNSTGCGVLLVVSGNQRVTVLQDTSVRPYDDIEDTLVGVVNNGTQPLSSLPLASTTDIFGFDGDGICAPGLTPQPSGCPFGPTGYEGPGVSFSGASADGTSALINFNPPIPPGGSAYFALEEVVTASVLTPGIVAGPGTLNFFSISGSQPAPQTLQILGTGSQFAYSASYRVQTPANGTWLSASYPSGGTERQTPDALVVSVNPKGLPVGVYTGYIFLIAPNAPNSPLVVPVTLAITTQLTASLACPLSAYPGSSIDQPITVNGGVPPYNLAMLSRLPSGVILDGDRITGSTTQPGSYPFTVQISDSGGQVITTSCSIQVQNFASALVGGCPVDGRTGSPYGPYTLEGAGGNGNFTFSASGLPAGLTLRGDTISGTITAPPGQYPVTLSVSSGGNTASRTCTLNVLPPLLTFSGGCPGGTLTPGDAFSQTLTAQGGTGTYAFGLVSGSLPAGLSLSGNRISGTITASPGTYKYSIRVTSGDQTATLDCSITVTAPRLTLSSGCPGNGIVNTPFGPFPLSATGGTGTYAFSVTGGSLPPGVALTGASIGGTPTQTGTYTFRIQATSGDQTAASAQCSSVISAPPIVVSGGGAVTGQAGSPVSFTVSASGGQAPFSFTFSGPSFLSLSQSGSSATISGTPTAPGTFAFTVMTTDAAGQTSTSNFVLTVTLPPVQLSGTCPTGSVTAGNAFSLALSATGGQGPYTYTLTGPAFLALSATSGASTSVTGTPQTAGSYPFTVTVQDGAQGSATFNCTLVVSTSPLRLTATGGGCPAATLTVPTPFSVAFSAAGGQPPYSYTYSGPSFLSLSSATGASTTLSGTPTAGSFNFSVTLSDSASTPAATYSCSLQVNPAVVPPATVTPTVPKSILDPVTLTLTLTAPTPVPLAGIVTITFTSNATVTGNNPQVQFLSSAATQSGRQFAFTIPAGGSSITLPAIQQSNVAGTIHIEITSLTDNGRDVLTNPHPAADVTVPRLAPVITDVSFANETATGFDIVISGYSTTRDLTTVNLTFQPRTGATLDGGTTFPVDVRNTLAQYYQTAAAANAGSSFTNLRIPITITGDKDSIGGVSVTLTNSTGTSDSVTKTR